MDCFSMEEQGATVMGTTASSFSIPEGETEREPPQDDEME